MSRILAIAFLLACSAAAPAQTFDVASIKPSTSQSVRGSEGGPGSKDPTRYKFELVAVDSLIALAYDVHRFQISAKTSLSDARYDFAARIPAGATKAEFHAMLRNFLAERFHLQTHT